MDKAKRVLTRYTLCRFATPQEWRDWYETNKDRIFFTESGGWFFMVNTRDLSVPGNDYRMRGQKIPGEDYRGEKRRVPETEAALTSDKNPVYVEMKTEEAENGNKWVVVKMNIHPGIIRMPGCVYRSVYADCFAVYFSGRMGRSRKIAVACQ